MRRGPLFWLGVAAGWTVMAIGIAGMIGQARFAKPMETALWIAGAALAHDAIVAPVVIAIARGLRRIVPPARLAAVQGVLIASALVVAVTLPVVLTLGRRADNASLLPRPYGAGLAVTLGALWLGSSIVAFGAARRRAAPGRRAR